MRGGPVPEQGERSCLLGRDVTDARGQKRGFPEGLQNGSVGYMMFPPTRATTFVLLLVSLISPFLLLLRPSDVPPRHSANAFTVPMVAVVR